MDPLTAYRNQMSEVDFTESLMAEAEAEGWRVYHIPDWMWKVAFGAWKAWGPRRGRTWPRKGFPDLVLLRPPEILFVEVKAAGGRVEPPQRLWLDELAECGLETAVWKPKDLGVARERLKRP